MNSAGLLRLATVPLLLLFTEPALAVVNSYSITDLGTLGGASSSASSLNESGQVVGTAQTSDGTDHAFLYSNGVMRDLGVLSGATTSTATSINDKGDVVGSSGTRAFLFHNGVMSDLGVLPSFESATYVATSVNNNLQIVGYISDGSYNGQSFLWTSANGMSAPGAEFGYIVYDEVSNRPLYTLYAEATVTIIVKPLVTGTISNSASASSSVGDPNTANNSASVTTMVK